MSDLPDLPPGWTWWRHSDLREPLAEVSAGGFRGLDLLERVRDAHDTILRAAIQAAADAAGVVLPEDYDPEAVLLDGARAHGWWWERESAGEQTCVHLTPPGGRHPAMICAAVVYQSADAHWCAAFYPWRPESPLVRGLATEAEACAAACEALGVPCPPIPPEAP